MDDYDREKVDEVVLALMQLTLHDFLSAPGRDLIGIHSIGYMRRDG